MKKTWILLMICCIAAACKKVDVQFTCTPEAPRAGEPVLFSNLSSSGEDWSWSFGDGSVSTVKSPTHTYKKPGTYRVILKVDNKSSLTATTELTVYDTIPTFVPNDSVFYIYKDYTFTANVYNPFNYTVTYEWFEGDSVIGTDASMTRFFTQPDDSAEVRLLLTINDVPFDIRKRFHIEDRETNSVYIRTLENDFRQRIFGDKAAMPQALETLSVYLETEQDTVQIYNGYEFTLSEIATVFPGVQGFHIANRKIYYRADGLWVANIDGANQVQIDAAACTAMTLDTKDSRIYWANENGVWFMPFIGSDNNKFVTVPTQLNEITNITKLATDGDKQ